MKKTKCVFCEQVRKRSVEHMWPQWLQNKIYGNMGYNHRGVWTHMLGVGVKDSRDQTGGSLVFGDVCTYCNLGWMKELEDDFACYFENKDINFQNIIKFSEKFDKSIDLWSLKTAMMINSGSNYRKIIPEEHYHYLYKYKNLPEGVLVQVFNIKQKGDLSWLQSNAIHVVREKGNIEEYLSEIKKGNKASYVITMQIRNVGIKVSWVKGRNTTGESFQLENQAYQDIDSLHEDTLVYV